MAASELVLEKARRLLSTGQVQIMAADQDRVTARVAGDSGGLYQVRWDRGAWSCTCANYGTCSHRLAVANCTMRPPAQSPLEGRLPRRDQPRPKSPTPSRSGGASAGSQSSTRKERRHGAVQVKS